MTIKNINKKKTIILITKEFPPQLGGAGIIASNIVSAIKNSNHKIILITSSSKLWFLFMFIKLKYYDLIKKNKTIIINDVGAMYVCGLALNKKKISKSILWLHGSEKEKAFKTKSKIKKLIFFNKVNLNLYKNVKYRVFVSNFLRKKFSDIKCFNGNSILIPNSISDTFTSTINSNRKKAINEKVNILTVSRIVKDKGYFRFLETFKVLPSKYHWTIVGDGPDLETLKNKIKSYGLSQRVVFLGKQNQKQLLPLYQSHDIFVLLSDFEESFGLVYIEALYCGIPVLANDKGALVDTLQGLHGVSFVKPSDNSDIIYNKLTDLLSNYQTFNDNKALILRRFGKDAFSTNLNKII
ncbi:glycosyltransferase family 4 protein [Providencia stuartii]|uniref:glycosyltransferase family 4 protein n=2 Tax=Morganellaceae TaxID=1903414 RepID=UPI0024AB889E|nr:glycosyltransferase family 4 protein [Providencia stuartii]MCR4081614.1 glycosyltransferase family 4 protein [Providencia stuartii]MDX7494647.1 glycosyltransferase family 4 protein [Providencia stuartii]